MSARLRSELRPADCLLEIQDRKLFRCTEASHVLRGFGIIFKDGLSGLLAASQCDARFPTIEQVQGAGAYLYNNSMETDSVDVFISHSWSAGRWGKFLALCLFFNLSSAIKISIAVWFLMASTLVAIFGVTGVGGSSFAFPCLVCVPLAIFFLVFIFGQELGLGPQQSLWLDRVCVHQTNLQLKEEQIAALPVFVANSSRMLILWDETYFDRAWCNLELATFAQKRGIDKVDVLPVWLAPWLLSSMVLDFLSASLLELLEHLYASFTSSSTNAIIATTESTFGKNASMLLFVAIFVIWMISGLPYLPVSIPSFFSFRMKLRNHQLLLEQMAAFDVRQAKCTFSSDREAIIKQVASMFQAESATSKEDFMVDEGEVQLQRFVLETLGTNEEDTTDRFNAHVRGPLRASVISQIGSAVNVPWQMAFTSFLPMIFYGSVNILACDNEDCDVSASNSGFRSVGEYMGSQVVGWIISIFVAFPLTCPVLLRLINSVLSYGDGPCQLCMAMLCCPLAYIYSYICGAFVWSSLFCLVQYYSTTQLLIFLAVLLILVLQSLWLFSQSAVGPAYIRQQSCRCVTRQTGPAETMPLRAEPE